MYYKLVKTIYFKVDLEISNNPKICGFLPTFFSCCYWTKNRADIFFGSKDRSEIKLTKLNHHILANFLCKQKGSENDMHQLESNRTELDLSLTDSQIQNT